MDSLFWAQLYAWVQRKCRVILVPLTAFALQAVTANKILVSEYEVDVREMP